MYTKNVSSQKPHYYYSHTYRCWHWRRPTFFYPLHAKKIQNIQIYSQFSPFFSLQISPIDGRCLEDFASLNLDSVWKCIQKKSRNDLRTLIIHGISTTKYQHSNTLTLLNLVCMPISMRSITIHSHISMTHCYLPTTQISPLLKHFNSKCWLNL